MKRMIVALALASMMLLGCSIESKYSQALDKLKGRMKDPSSVQFRNLHEVEYENGKPFLCGEYNAKNGFGGYDGFERFETDKYGDLLHTQHDADFDFYWNTRCDRSPTRN
ncbi:MAG: hypothetical protein ACYCZD_15825 [Rhodanobacter sp.]